MESGVGERYMFEPGEASAAGMLFMAKPHHIMISFDQSLSMA